jgi:predicted secreted protein
MKRSKKVMFVSHSLLNQNSMPKDKGKYPGMVTDLIELLSESGVGLVQLPSAEISFGAPLGRKHKTKDTLDTAPFRKHCKSMASGLMDDIEKYMKAKYQIVGILGLEHSPVEAVHQIDNGNRIVPGKGILMEEIEAEMKKRRFQVPIVGVNINNIYSSLERVQSMMNCA